MPIISKFYGIEIKMYFVQHEHNPPHFHAYYGEYTAVFDIQTLRIIEGSLPQKAKLLVFEWADVHRDELLNIWNTQNFEKLPPLE